MKAIALVLSCEHAVNTVPEAYQACFRTYNELLNSHRGMDFGALMVAKYLQNVFNCELIQADASRLLIDCNRSLSNARCFSEVTRQLAQEEKDLIIQNYYLPFRQEVEQTIRNHIAAGQQVWHLSIHSFTPVWHTVIRKAEVGFLYDPRRRLEKTLARTWQQQLKQQASHLRVRLNYPYRGISDGFTSTLRKQFANEVYAGIEVEFNQALAQDEKTLNALAAVLADTFQGRSASPGRRAKRPETGA